MPEYSIISSEEVRHRHRLAHCRTFNKAASLSRRPTKLARRCFSRVRNKHPKLSSSSSSLRCSDKKPSRAIPGNNRAPVFRHQGQPAAFCRYYPNSVEGRLIAFPTGQRLPFILAISGCWSIASSKARRPVTWPVWLTPRQKLLVNKQQAFSRHR